MYKFANSGYSDQPLSHLEQMFRSLRHEFLQRIYCYSQSGQTQIRLSQTPTLMPVFYFLYMVQRLFVTTRLQNVSAMVMFTYITYSMENQDVYIRITFEVYRSLRQARK